MENKKKLVGLASPAKLFENDNVYADRYMFTNTYGARVRDAGGIPVGIIPIDGYVTEEQLEFCDSFVLCGGTGIKPYYIQIIYYAVRNKKKLLGICLGMQSIYAYFKTVEIAKNIGYSGDMVSLFSELNKDEDPFRRNVDGHRPYEIMPRGKEDLTKHKVFLEAESNISRILGTNLVLGASLHVLCVGEPIPSVKFTGRAEDGVVEALEYIDFIIGTQFHPDVDDKLIPLFSFLLE